MTTKLRRTTVLLLAAGLAACESATDPGDELGTAEASALAGAILSLTMDATLSQTAPSALSTGPARAPVTFEHDVQLEGPCPLGGTMDLSLHAAGSFDDATGRGQLDLDVAAAHRGCRVAAEETGQRFELDGAPGIEAAYRLVIEPDQSLTLDGSYQGAVTWASEGRSGTCSFDLDFSGSVSALDGTGSATLEGTACGISIRHEVSG